MSTNVVFWSRICLFANVIKTIRHLRTLGGDSTPRMTVTYRAKVKLHGTNCAVQRTADGLVAQSRTKVLSPSDDNKGFARWVAEQEDGFAQLAPSTTVFGEWCGPGVAHGVAISKLDRKIFAVFALQEGRDDEATLVVEPERIAEMLPALDDVFVLPWLGESVTIDYTSDLEPTADAINEVVAAVEQRDPWVYDTFGVSGVGEGVVLYPAFEPLTPALFELYAFKAKGEQHQTVATKKPAQVSPEVAAGAREFAGLVVTRARLQQGVDEACGGLFEMQHMGSFIRWVVSDTQKESEIELEAAGLTWKQVAPAVTKRAREWYQAKSKRTSSRE